MGVDAYVLGSADVWGLVWRLLAVGALILICSPFIFFVPSVYRRVLAPLITVIRNYRAERDLALAVRQQFHHRIDNHSFNNDDIVMTLKSALPLVLTAIRDVFARHGLPVQALDHSIAAIQNVQHFHNYAPNTGMQGIFNAAAQMSQGEGKRAAS